MLCAMIRAQTNSWNVLTSRPCTKKQPADHKRSKADRLRKNLASRKIGKGTSSLITPCESLRRGAESKAVPVQSTFGAQKKRVQAEPAPG